MVQRHIVQHLIKLLCYIKSIWHFRVVYVHICKARGNKLENVQELQCEHYDNLPEVISIPQDLQQQDVHLQSLLN